MHAIINLHTKYGTASAWNFGVSFCVVKMLWDHIYGLFNCTTIGAEPDLSTFRLARSRPELWSTLCVTVLPNAARATTLSTLERKRSTFEVKMPHLALEGVEASCWKCSNDKTFEATRTTVCGPRLEGVIQDSVSSAWTKNQKQEEDWNRLEVCS